VVIPNDLYIFVHTHQLFILIETEIYLPFMSNKKINFLEEAYAIQKI